MSHFVLRREVSVKSKSFKELTPRSRTYELRGQGKKSSIRFKDKQTPHTVLQKLSPKVTPRPLKIFEARTDSLEVNEKRKKWRGEKGTC